jgi:hypothetical protein
MSISQKNEASVGKEDIKPNNNTSTPSQCVTTHFNPYQYTQLNTWGQHIRLFRLWWSSKLKAPELIIEQFDLPDAPPFYAVSYTWGDPPATESLYINGTVLKIRKNLFHFFEVLTTKHMKKNERYKGDNIWLWADQVCVNQLFSEERNHQVQMMGSIFSQAVEVLVWLGDDKSGETALQKIKMMGEDDAEILMPNEAYGNSIGLRDFSNNPYWERLWIVQEIVLARSLTIFLRNSILEGPKFDVFCQKAKSFNTIMHNCTLFDLIYKKRYEQVPDAGKAQSLLLDACYATLFSKCEDPRDKIYGLQGLLAEDQRAVIDYTQPKEQVLLDAAIKICTASGDHMVYELAWYVTQIAFGMGLLTVEDANTFFVSTSTKICGQRPRAEQMQVLMQLLGEKFGSTKTVLTGQSSDLSEKLGRLTPSWVV